MHQETIQKAVEAIQRVMKPIIKIIKDLIRLWNTLKAWVAKHPSFVKLLRREMAKRNKKRLLSQPFPTVKAYRSQVTYRPVPRVARSRC